MLLSLSWLSKPYLLGPYFILLNPYAIWISLLPLIAILTIHVLWQKRTDKFILNLCKSIPEDSNTSENNFHKKLLSIEKNIYLFIYFISDIIASFELFNLLALGTIYTPFVPINTLAFILSCLYALYIHINCRQDDFDERYSKLQAIIGQKEFKVSLKSMVVIALLYALLYLALSLPATSIAACVCLGFAFILGLSHYKEALQLPYGIYLNIFAYKQMKNFTTTLIEQSAPLNIHTPIPFAVTAANIMFTSLASIYSLVYLNSTVRNRALNTGLPAVK